MGHFKINEKFYLISYSGYKDGTGMGIGNMTFRTKKKITFEVLKEAKEIIAKDNELKNVVILNIVNLDNL